MKRPLFALIFLSAAAVAQNRFPPINLANSDPSGVGCTIANAIQQYQANIYICTSGTWHAVTGSGGSGTVSGQTPAAIPLATAATTIGKASPLSVDDVNTPTLITNSVAYKGPTITGSVNKVISVIAPPYNAKCDGSTDDQTAIQAAFDAALSATSQVQFPAGTCVTSTITWKGQPFFGAGITQTTIKGKPGQDVFATPDDHTWTPPANGTLVHDLWILVDNTVDKSASVHGDNTFPNRIAGTLGGTGNIITPAISPGVFAFGTYSGTYANGVAFTQATGCNGQITGALNLLQFTGANCVGANGGAGLNHIDSWRVIGAPITVKGKGGAGSDLVTTITAVSSDGTTVTLASPADATGSNLSGTALNPVNDGPDSAHFYLTIGNCGFAFPDSNGSAGTHAQNLSRFVFDKIMISPLGFPWAGNHTCGMFVQAPPYAMKLTNSVISQFYAGYVEALPASNPTGTTWTGDTSAFINDDFQFSIYPFIIMGGNHRTFTGISFYGGSEYQTMGPMWLHGGSSGTITRLYYECSSFNTGEQVRLTGTAGFQIDGGTFGQCNATGYTEWVASNSEANAQFLPVVLATGANNNKIRNSVLLNPNQVSDFGSNNSVATQSGTNASKVAVSYLNNPREPIGKNDSACMLSGNAQTGCYLSANDLLTTCWDFGVMNNQPSVGTCNPDPTGTELSLSYFRSAAATTVVDGLNNGGVANTWSNIGQRTFGKNIPRTKVNVIVSARCTGCTVFSFVLLVKDGTTNTTLGTSPTLTFSSTSFVKQTFKGVDLSSATVGDVLDYRIQTVTNDGTTYDISSIRIEPQNDAVLNDLVANGLPVSGTAPSPTRMAVANAASAKLCSGPSSVTAGHYFTASGTGGCDLVDAGVPPAALLSTVPPWLQQFGDGSDGALNITSGTTNIAPGVHYYTTCNISAGAIGAIVVSAVPPGAPAILFCTGTFTLAGTLSFSQNTGSSTGVSGAGNFGGGGGGGGGGTGAGTTGGAVNGINAGVAGTSSGGAGGAGTAPNVALQRLLLTFGSNSLGSFQCGGASGGAGGTGAAAGGRGGGCVIIVAPTINFTGTIDVTGVNGTASAANNNGGGGAGGGGAVILRSPAMTNSGTITVTGGTGGGCGAFTNCGVGGNGATGWSKVYSQ